MATKHFCDYCGKEVKDNDHYRRYDRRAFEMDACGKCNKKIEKLEVKFKEELNAVADKRDQAVKEMNNKPQKQNKWWRIW